MRQKYTGCGKRKSGAYRFFPTRYRIVDRLYRVEKENGVSTLLYSDTSICHHLNSTSFLDAMLGFENKLFFLISAIFKLLFSS